MIFILITIIITNITITIIIIILLIIIPLTMAFSSAGVPGCPPSSSLVLQQRFYEQCDTRWSQTQSACRGVEEGCPKAYLKHSKEGSDITIQKGTAVKLVRKQSKTHTLKHPPPHTHTNKNKTKAWKLVCNIQANISMPFNPYCNALILIIIF